MAQATVSNCVLSIVASFSSGVDVLRARRRSSQRRGPANGAGTGAEDQDEVRLSRSLRRGPEDITREYRKSLLSVGDRFAVGDGMKPLLIPYLYLLSIVELSTDPVIVR